MRVLAMLVAAVAVGALSAGGPDVNKKALEQLQGEWNLEKGLRGGKPFPDEKVQGSVMVIKDNKIVIKEAGRDKLEEATFTIDAGQKPPAIDITPSNDKQVKGIFQVDGDKLKMTFARPGNERPTEFGSAEGSETVSIELRRAKK